MPQADLERHLTCNRRKWRIIKLVIALLVAALAVGFHYLWETNTQIVYHEPPPHRPDAEGWESVEHSPGYLFISIACTLVSTISATLLIVDFIYCRFKTLRKGDQYLTVYRGIFHCSIYVDGVEKGFHCPLIYSNVVEVWMANRIRVTVSLSRHFWYVAHISFSDDTASVEI